MQNRLLNSTGGGRHEGHQVSVGQGGRIRGNPCRWKKHHHHWRIWQRLCCQWRLQHRPAIKRIWRLPHGGGDGYQV